MPSNFVNLTLHVDEVDASRQYPPSNEYRPLAFPQTARAPDSAHKSRAGQIWAAIALALLLVGSAGYWTKTSLPEVAVPRPDRIGLGIERTGHDVQITWDGASALLRSATLGILRIRDGTNSKDIRISPEELKQGSLLYIPASNDVEIHMKVFTPDDRSVDESVRIIYGDVPDKVEKTEIPPPEPETLDIPNIQDRSRTPDGTSRQIPPATAAVKSAKLFVPPAARVTAHPQTDAMAVGLAPPQISPQISQQGSNVQLPHREEMQVTPPAPNPPPPEQAAQPAGQVQPTTAPAETIIFPPTPRLQVSIIIPDHLKRLISKDIAIDVRCTVAPDGRVTRVTSLSSKHHSKVNWRSLQPSRRTQVALHAGRLADSLSPAITSSRSASTPVPNNGLLSEIS